MTSMDSKTDETKINKPNSKQSPQSVGSTRSPLAVIEDWSTPKFIAQVTPRSTHQNFQDSRSRPSTSFRGKADVGSEGIRGSILWIGWLSILATTPLLFISAALLGIIFKYQVSLGRPITKELRLPGDEEDPTAYFVDYSATRLATLASWASNVATFIPGLLLSLFSYRIALVLQQNSEDPTSSQLPTPYQLSLLLELYSGKILSIWNWLTYYFSRREKNVSAFNTAFYLVVLTTILAYSICVVDTWLHISMSTKYISRISEAFIPSTPGAHLENTTSTIPPDCANIFANFTTEESFEDPCFNNTFNQDPFAKWSIRGDQILNESPSTTSRLSNVTNSETGKSEYFTTEELDLDYTASTFSFSTECMVMTTQCDLRGSSGGNSVFFNCSTDFNGNFGTYQPADYPYLIGNSVPTYTKPCFDFGSGCLATFTKPDFTSGINADRPYTQDLNPLYLGFAIKSSLSMGINDSSESTSFFGGYGPVYFILGCQMNISDITYSRVNGTFIFNNASLSNNNVAFIANNWNIGGLGIYNMALVSMLEKAIAPFTSDSDSNERVLFDNIANGLSSVFAAFSSATWTTVPGLAQQRRSTELVTSVPKLPLFVLVFLCVIVSCFGILLGVVALSSQPIHTEDVQARLSVAGLMASHFEAAHRAEAKVSSIEELFAEQTSRSKSTRVGITRTSQGGWKYVSVPYKRLNAIKETNIGSF